MDKRTFLAARVSVIHMTNRRRPLPPLAAIRAFEAAARHASFSHAAEELCVTHGAISHQIKSLERSLGIPLFQRLTRRVQPPRCDVELWRRDWARYHGGR